MREPLWSHLSLHWFISIIVSQCDCCLFSVSSGLLKHKRTIVIVFVFALICLYYCPTPHWYWCLFSVSSCLFKTWENHSDYIYVCTDLSLLLSHTDTGVFFQWVLVFLEQKIILNVFVLVFSCGTTMLESIFLTY